MTCLDYLSRRDCPTLHIVLLETTNQPTVGDYKQTDASASHCIASHTTGEWWFELNNVSICTTKC